MQASTNVRQELISWFQRHRRDFYWRTHTDTYTVLIAEILLRKTTAGAVQRLIPAFLRRYPNVQALHGGHEIQLRRLLAPLGLSEQRSAQLKQLASVLAGAHNGKIPCDKRELLALPGVGDYTAGAVLSFACGKPEAVVDTNIARILVRLFKITPSHYEARRSPEVWEKAQELVGEDGSRSKVVNWALLDLASAVCKPKNPAHDMCPVRTWCAYARGSQ